MAENREGNVRTYSQKCMHMLHGNNWIHHEGHEVTKGIRDVARRRGTHCRSLSVGADWCQAFTIDNYCPK